MNQISLHTERVKLFSFDNATTKDIEKHIESICISECQELTPRIDFWSSQLEYAIERLLKQIVVELHGITDEFLRYKLLSKSYYYENALNKKTLNFQYEYNSINYLTHLILLQNILKIALAKADKETTIDILIEDVELSNLITKCKLYMQTNGKKMSIQESNRIHDEQVNTMKELVSLYSQKRDFIKKRMKSQNGIEKIDSTIGIAILESKINTGNRYIQAYDKRRAKNA